MTIELIALMAIWVVVTSIERHRERQGWAQERQTLLDRIQAPEKVLEPVRQPLAIVPPLIPEDAAELSKVGSIILDEDKDK